MEQVVGWERSPQDAYLYNNDRFVFLNIAKMTPESYTKFSKTSPEALEEMGRLKIERTAFYNRLSDICLYVDFFIEYYDYDKELPVTMLNLKNVIDDGKIDLTSVEFKNVLYRRLLSGNLKDKIYKMVCEQYHINVTVSKTTGRVYDNDDDFTNMDAARFQAISMMMKIMIPFVEHFFMVSVCAKRIPNSKQDFIVNLFHDVFYEMGNVSDMELFKYGNIFVDREEAQKIEDQKKRRLEEYKKKRAKAKTYWERHELDQEYLDPYEEAEKLNMKMYRHIRKWMEKHRNNNQPLWIQHAALRGLTENSHQNLLIDKCVFYDNFFKFNFGQNIISFLQTVVNTQLDRTIISAKYKKDPIQIDIDKAVDKRQSAMEQFEQTQLKVDESRLIRIDMSIYDILERLDNQYGPISEHEIEYYSRFPLNDNMFRNYLLENMFAKSFNGFTELLVMTNYDRIRLSIIGKRQLIAEGYVILPWLLTSTIKGKVSNRIIQNAKFLSDFEASPNYQYVKRHVYPSLEGAKDDFILEDVSRIINNFYCFVEYNAPEITGEVIQYDKLIAANEYLNFLLRE